MTKERLELGGKRFGRFTVLSRVVPTPPDGQTWLCRCDCGEEKQVLQIRLREGRSRSCGCLAREVMAQRKARDWHRRVAR